MNCHNSPSILACSSATVSLDKSSGQIVDSLGAEGHGDRAALHPLKSVVWVSESTERPAQLMGCSGVEGSRRGATMKRAASWRVTFAGAVCLGFASQILGAEPSPRVHPEGLLPADTHNARLFVLKVADTGGMALPKRGFNRDERRRIALLAREFRQHHDVRLGGVNPAEDEAKRMLRLARLNADLDDLLVAFWLTLPTRLGDDLFARLLVLTNEQTTIEPTKRTKQNGEKGQGSEQ